MPLKKIKINPCLHMETQRLVSWLMQAMAAIRVRSQSMYRLLCDNESEMSSSPPVPDEYMLSNNLALAR